MGIQLEDGNGSILLEPGTGIILLESAGTIGQMPNCVGLLLQAAIALLQQVGIVVPASIGYFGIYPVSVTWAADISQPGVVVAQSIAVGTSPVAPNTPIRLIVNDFAVSVAFP
jgi:beta-lactam-binding protein with PASTA domain